MNGDVPLLPEEQDGALDDQAPAVSIPPEADGGDPGDGSSLTDPPDAVHPGTVVPGKKVGDAPAYDQLARLAACESHITALQAQVDALQSLVQPAEQDESKE